MRSAADYRGLFEHSLDAMLLTAPDGRILMANAAATQLFGWSDEELRALGREGVADASDPRLGRAIEERRRTGRFRGELRLRRKDGTCFDAEISTAVFRDESGELLSSLFIRDVTLRNAGEAEREALLEAVRASERLLNGIFEVLPVGVWIADSTGRIVRGNAAGQRIWGGARYVGPGEFAEYKGWWVDTGKPIEPQDWALARALTRGETSVGELIRIQCFDGSRKTVINSAIPLYDERGKFAGAIAVNQDVTRLMEVEGALRRAIEMREHVLAVVAHDLRNPLQVIRLQLERLLPAQEPRSDLRRRLESVERAAKRMDRLIEDLLDVMRIDAGQLVLRRTSVAPEALLQEALQATRPIAAAANLEIDAQARGAVAAVHADPGRIVQVLDNLIGNAVKFSPAGGRISIGAEPDGEAVRFSVRDTGRGIDAQALPHVFDRLWQGHLDRRGLGLGLAIVKGIVEAHGGKAWAESEPGRGSTFYFTLPAVTG